MKLKDGAFYLATDQFGDPMIVVRKDGEWSILFDDGSYFRGSDVTDAEILKSHPVKVKV